MSKRISYRKIGGPDGALANRLTFTGNSMSAVRTEDRYRVYSYSTLIAEVICDEMGNYGEPYVSESRYSTTTSRHQNLCRAWL